MGEVFRITDRFEIPGRGIVCLVDIGKGTGQILGIDDYLKQN